MQQLSRLRATSTATITITRKSDGDNATQTCAPLILQNGRTDLRSDNAMKNILNRLFNAQFNHVTDAAFVQDAATVAAETAKTTAEKDATRTAEKVDPPQQ